MTTTEAKCSMQEQMQKALTALINAEGCAKKLNNKRIAKRAEKLTEALQVLMLEVAELPGESYQEWSHVAEPKPSEMAQSFIKELTGY